MQLSACYPISALALKISHCGRAVCKDLTSEVLRDSDCGSCNRLITGLSWSVVLKLGILEIVSVYFLLKFLYGMRKLLRGGQVSITRVFADSNVERVILQSSLHADSVTHSMSSVNPPRTLLPEERVRRKGRWGSSIRALHGAGGYGEHFATLGLSAAASRPEIKKAYRELARQYHPDVCEGEHCDLVFKQVNNAYKVALEVEEQGVTNLSDDCLDGFMGANDDTWDDWEEWMGWEGAGVSDNSFHVNTASSF